MRSRYQVFNNQGIKVNEFISGLASTVTLYDSYDNRKSIKYHSFPMSGIIHNYHNHENYSALSQSLKYLASEYTYEDLGLVTD